MSPIEPLFTVNDIADMLGCKVGKVRQLKKAGILKSVWDKPLKCTRAQVEAAFEEIKNPQTRTILIQPPIPVKRSRGRPAGSRSLQVIRSNTAG